MAISDWSTTASNNANAVSGINWQEGMPPSAVNDSARQMMADVASWRDEIDPAGRVIAYAGSSAPSGWLECNGANVSRTTYARLFAAIGTTFGAGDGSTTFTLPDLRRRVVVGAGGTGTSVLGNTVGSSGGAETHTLTTNEIPSHQHGLSVLTQSGGVGGGGGNWVMIGTPGGASTDAAGGGAAHNNMQPSLVFMMLIRV